FFSSRRRHTRFSRDWSSDVCSSDLFSPEVILLDDAFQHRKVKAGLNILLTSYGNLYTSDWILPAGNLRESVKGAKRAEIIVVTRSEERRVGKECRSRWWTYH